MCVYVCVSECVCVCPLMSQAPPPLPQFYRHSKGMPAITEEDFASILLKHTSTKMSEVHQRLQERKAPDCKVGVV